MKKKECGCILCRNVPRLDPVSNTFVQSRILKPFRLPNDIFDMLHFPPDPMPAAAVTATDAGVLHYKPFDEVFGKNTSEEHRPSLKKHMDEVLEKGTISGPNVRHRIQCNSCKMWRCVFSQSPLKALDARANAGEMTATQQLQLCREWWKCGLALVAEDNPLRAFFGVNSSVHCRDEMEDQYYGSKKVWPED